jgi:neutral ceramidase
MLLLTAGFGISRITPPPGARLAGYAARTSNSAGVHDDLHVRALTLSNGERSLALVSVDVLALDSAFIAQARAAISSVTGLAPEAVMIAATHTHGGPITAAMFSPDAQAIDPNYMESLRGGIVAATRDAWEDRFQAQIGIGSAHAVGIGGNRHHLDGATDPELGLLRVTDLNGRTRAVCLNYACHPTVLGPHNLQVTADFPGFALARITERLGQGAFAMFLNGAAGNISVGRSPEATALGLASPGRTFERAAQIGHALADLAIETLPSIETTDQCPLEFATRSIELNLRPLPDPKESEAAKLRAQERVAELQRTGQTSAEIQKAQLQALYAGLTHFEACRRSSGEQRATLEIQVFRIGDAVLLGMPVEPFVEVGLELKRSAAIRLFIIELANGYMGYLPASGASNENGYETISARFITGSDKVLIEHALELTQELVENETARKAHS